MTEEGFAKAQEEWEKTVSQWGAFTHPPLSSFLSFRSLTTSALFLGLAEAKQENIKEAGARTGESTPGAPPPSARQSTEDAASGKEQEPPRPPALTKGGEGDTPKVAGKPEPHPPWKKYRMTELMKGIV